jgi:uncharacterized protein (DUF342 family)
MSEDTRFGAIAIQQGWATAEQIEQALRDQKRILHEKQSVALIGDILVNAGILEAEKRDTIIKIQKKLRYQEGDNAAAAKPQSKSQPETEPEPVETGFILAVSDDKLEALIYPTDPPPSNTTPAEFLEFLSKKGIVHGIAPENLIQEYLSKQPLPKKPWRVAVGKSPGPTRDERVIYHFDDDPLRVGTVKQGGHIDFRDRGEIPQVKAGDLIAEKKEGHQGSPGIDVFGKEIPAPKPKPAKLPSGPGVERSEDGEKVHAKIGGRPSISPDGKISIHPELRINGDVGLETGHIEFDGRVDVEGAVQEGFRVKSASLSAAELLDCEVEVTGDLVVAGGIMGAKVQVGGHLRAMYIHRSKIEVVGDVMAESEIYHSDIASSGLVKVDKGKILYSNISANKGIETVDVGSEASQPSTLSIGVDVALRKAIEEFKENTRGKKEESDRLREIVNEMMPELERLEEMIEEQVQIRDTALQQQHALVTKIKETKGMTDQKLLLKARKTIEHLKETIGLANEQLEKLEVKRKNLVDKMVQHEDVIRKHFEEMESMKEELNALAEWSRKQAGNPVLQVSGTIYPGNKVRGVNASITFKEPLEHTVVKETRTTDLDDGSLKWEMHVSPLT